MNKSTRTFKIMNNYFSLVSYSVYIRVLKVYLLVSSTGHFRDAESVYFSRLRESFQYENDFFHNIECFCNYNFRIILSNTRCGLVELSLFASLFKLLQ